MSNEIAQNEMLVFAAWESPQEKVAAFRKALDTADGQEAQKLDGSNPIGCGSGPMACGLSGVTVFFTIVVSMDLLTIFVIAVIAVEISRPVSISIRASPWSRCPVVSVKDVVQTPPNI